MDEKISIAMVDDHTLFRRGLAQLILGLGDQYTVCWDVGSGQECLRQLESGAMPDLLILDVSMPEMDGYTLAAEVKKKYPDLPMLVVSMIDKEEALIRMLRLGIRGYLSKNIEAEELDAAIRSVRKKGYYYTDHVTGKLIHALQTNGSLPGELPALSDREQHFLQLACSEDTYKEIADKMFLSVKTIDGYRMTLFEKLGVKSRTGLVLYAIRNGLVKI